MNLKPLDDRIVVRPQEAETQTASGLVIPDTAKEKPQQGEVLAVGPGKRSDSTGELIEVGINVGDKLCLSEHGAYDCHLCHLEKASDDDGLVEMRVEIGEAQVRALAAKVRGCHLQRARHGAGEAAHDDRTRGAKRVADVTRHGKRGARSDDHGGRPGVKGRLFTPPHFKAAVCLIFCFIVHDE